MEIFKVGDRVWVVGRGWSTVTEISSSVTEYPVKIKYGVGGTDEFTLEGKRYTRDIQPSVFFEEVKLPELRRPLPKLEVDTKVRVWDYSKDGAVNRYFSHFDSDQRIHCFNNGQTYWSSAEGKTTSWNYFEVV